MGVFLRHFRAFAAVSGLSLATAGGVLAQTSADPVVATVNGDVIKRSDVVAFYRSLPQQTQTGAFEDMYPKLLDRLVTSKMIAQAGKKEGLASDAGVQRRVAEFEERLVQEAYLGRMVAKAVTDDALRARYEKALKDNPGRLEISARHILVATEAQGKDVIAQLKRGADFGALAKQLSIEPSAKDQGGQLGFFSREEMVPEFSAAAFKMKDGEVSAAPVRTPFGWHVIRVDARRTLQPKFEEMKDKLAAEMAQELMNDAVTRLRRDAKVEIAAPTAPPTGEERRR